MVTHPKTLLQTDFRTIVDIILINLGVLAGGFTALLGLWLWLDYQAHPTHSTLAFITGQLVAALPPAVGEYFGLQARLMDLPLAGQTSAYWYMARAGGVVAYLLLWLSTVWGLVMSTKITAHLIPAPLAYGLHEFLSILAIVFALLHSVALLGDEYIQFNIFHLAVPFIAPYEPLWTGLGTIALYLSVALTASFYIRKQIGQKTWRALHYFTFVAYLLAAAHGLMAGTDSPLAVVKLIYWGSGAGVLFLVYYRLFTLKAKKFAR